MIVVNARILMMNMATMLNGDVIRSGRVCGSGCSGFGRRLRNIYCGLGAAFGRNNIPNGVWLR